MADSTTIVHDAVRPSRDLAELRALSTRRRPPRDATPHNAPDLSRRAAPLVPWLYDFDYGWTPRRERIEPRPPLNLPPYFSGDFPLRTCGLKNGKHYFITVDLRALPAEMRVFLKGPAEVFTGVGSGRRRPKKPAGVGFEVVRRIADFNRIFGQRVPTSFGRGQVLFELKPGTRVIFDRLNLSKKLQELHVFYAVQRPFLRPKTYYTMQLAQFIDHRLVGTFNHALLAHHNYDVPVIGDRRTRIAYRRSSQEVAAIPPLALAFFGSWKEAQAAGYDFSPRSFGKHFSSDSVSVALADDVLRFFNKTTTTAQRIVATVVDNPHVNAGGGAEPAPHGKRGIDLKTAERLVEARKKLPKQRFTRLQEIAAVRGIGADTMSDILTSILAKRRQGPTKSLGRWLPDPKVTALLKPRGARH